MDIDETIRRENSLVKLLNAARDANLYVGCLSEECCKWSPDWRAGEMYDQAGAIHGHILEAWREVKAAITHIEYLIHAVGESE